MAPAFKSYREIDAWKPSAELRDRILKWTSAGPAARDFEFRKQIRTSSRSAPANLAEGFGRCRPREFAHFVRIARASLLETQNHLEDAQASGYIDEEGFRTLCRLAERSVGATTNLLKYLESCDSDPPFSPPRRPPRRPR